MIKKKTERDQGVMKQEMDRTGALSRENAFKKGWLCCGQDWGVVCGLLGDTRTHLRRLVGESRGTTICMGGGGKLTVRAAQAKSATLYYWKTTGAVRHAAARRTLALIITDHPLTTKATTTTAHWQQPPWESISVCHVLLLCMSVRMSLFSLHLCISAPSLAPLPAQQSGVGEASLHSSTGPGDLGGASFHAGRRESNVIRPARN